MDRQRLVTALMAAQGALAVAGGLTFIRAATTTGGVVGVGAVSAPADLLALALFAWSLGAAAIAQAVQGDQETAVFSVIGIVGFVMLFYGQLRGPRLLAAGGLAVLCVAGVALVVRGVEEDVFGKDLAL